MVEAKAKKPAARKPRTKKAKPAPVKTFSALDALKSRLLGATALGSVLDAPVSSFDKAQMQEHHKRAAALAASRA